MRGSILTNRIIIYSMKFGFFHLLYISLGSYKLKELKASDHMTTYQCPWRFIFPGVNGDIFRNQDNNEWYKAGVKLVEDNFKLKPNTNTAKSAILFLGDGMGITTITATRILDGQQKGNTGEENVLSWEVFPWSALAKTYTVDQQGTDSASSATAFLSGIKTDNGKFKPYPYLPNSYWRPNISRPLKPWKLSVLLKLLLVPRLL